MRTPLIVLLGILIASTAALADDYGNSPLAAHPIEPDGTLVTACIEEAGDMDYFLFHAIAGRTYRLTTSHPTEGMDSILYLIDRDGLGILAVDVNTAGDTNARIVWMCRESAVYFVMVRHAQATTGTGCYGLSVFAVLLDDHGNDRLSATPIAAGAEMTGFLEEPGDVDVFMIRINRGYEYTLRFLSQVAGKPLTASVFGNGVTDPVLVVTSDGSSQVEAIPTSTVDTLFIVIESAGTDTGSYGLLIERGGYADDHGNSAASATPIAAGWTQIQGNLEVVGDVDWFELSARKEADYMFILTAATQPSSRLRLALRGADGQVLHEASTTVSGEAVELNWQAPETGTYFLEVSSASGTGSYVLKIASTLQLQAIGTFNPSGYSLDVDVVGDTAYLIVGTKGLLVLDVSDPTAPFELGSNSTNGYAQAIAVSGTTALVANRSEGVTVIDVSDPSRPVMTSTFDTPGSAQSITVHQGLVLIADQRGGLQIARLQSGQLSTVSSLDTRGYPAAVAAMGSIALVALGDAGLELVDLAQPGDPVSVGYLDLPGDASGVAVFGQLAYVATGYRGVRVVDVSEASSPIEVGWISTAGEAVSVLVSGNTLFVAERTEGVSAYSLVNPLEPQLVARVDTPGEATALAAMGGYIYVADRQEGMLIVQLLP